MVVSVWNRLIAPHISGACEDHGIGLGADRSTGFGLTGITSAQITTQTDDNGKPVAFEKEQPRLASLSCPEQTSDEESCFIITVSMAQ